VALASAVRSKRATLIGGALASAAAKAGLADSARPATSANAASTATARGFTISFPLAAGGSTDKP
jgi:hypothetical protein